MSRAVFMTHLQYITVSTMTVHVNEVSIATDAFEGRMLNVIIFYVELQFYDSIMTVQGRIAHEIDGNWILQSFKSIKWVQNTICLINYCHYIVLGFCDRWFQWKLSIM